MENIIELKGNLLQERSVKKNYPIKYELINGYLDLDISFLQKIWHYIYKIKEVPKCKVCNNKDSNFKNLDIGYTGYCSKECMVNDPELKEKMKESRRKTSLNRYGVDNPNKLQNIKDKLSNTKLNKSEEEKQDIQNKLKNTNLERYGVENVAQLKEIQEKRIESFKENIDSWKESYKKTSQERYGTNHPWQSEIVKDVFKNTMIELYGEDNPNKVENIKYKILQTRKENIIKTYPDKQILLIERDFFTIMCNNCKKSYKISRDLFRYRYNKEETCTNCNQLNLSKPENSLKLFISEIYDNTLELNRRIFLNGKEIDIYLPDLKIGFEFNGIYWHNELQKDKDYHLEKTELAENNNIKLIHIYEDDWYYKKDIIKSRIKNILNLSDNKIYARKCDIKEINTKEEKDFLEKNHIQGYTPSKIKYGLYYNNELVSLMTFSVLRKALGQISIENEYELLRFCTILNTNVIGGADRLFKHFIKEYNPIRIISYADRSWSKGNLYYKLGFNFINNTPPNYWYVVDGIKKHRFNYRKDVLVKEGYDSNMTEHEIMMSRKIYRIYDSGSLKFEWKNE